MRILPTTMLPMGAPTFPNLNLTPTEIWEG